MASAAGSSRRTNDVDASLLAVPLGENAVRERQVQSATVVQRARGRDAGRQRIVAASATVDPLDDIRSWLDAADDVPDR